MSRPEFQDYLVFGFPASKNFIGDMNITLFAQVLKTLDGVSSEKLFPKVKPTSMRRGRQLVASCHHAFLSIFQAQFPQGSLLCH